MHVIGEYAQATLELDDGSSCMAMPQARFGLYKNSGSLKFKRWQKGKRQDMLDWAAKNPLKFKGMKLSRRVVGRVVSAATYAV